jgi:TatD DNase family protein
MLIDTHCHLNLLVDYSFDKPLTKEGIENAQTILDEAAELDVLRFLNVGTSLIESLNCIELAKRYDHIYASVGIHPNDLNDTWRTDIEELSEILKQKNELKITAIGECGLDKHYPGYNLPRQIEAFKKQIDLSLEYDLSLVIHTRDAGPETLEVLEEYKDAGLRGTIHCFSEDLHFAQKALSYGFVLGIGGTITYPKNSHLREVVKTVGLDHIILETDAPFLPPQVMRGKKNHPKYIKLIAEYVADLLEVPYEKVAQKTTTKAMELFQMR